MLSFLFILTPNTIQNNYGDLSLVNIWLRFHNEPMQNYMKHEHYFYNIMLALQRHLMFGRFTNTQRKIVLAWCKRRVLLNYWIGYPIVRLLRRILTNVGFGVDRTSLLSNFRQVWFLLKFFGTKKLSWIRHLSCKTLLSYGWWLWKEPTTEDRPCRSRLSSKILNPFSFC